MAKKNVSAIVSGADLSDGIITDLIQAVRERGGTDGDIHQLATPDIHQLATPDGRKRIGKFADIIVQSSEEYFPLTVNYNQSLREMIEAGHYDSIDDSITEKNFPIKGNGTVDIEIILVHLNRSASFISTKEAEEGLEKRNFRPATLPELLALGAKYPDLQRKYQIVALGTVQTYPEEHYCVACLHRVASERYIYLESYASDRSVVYRFAAVRKSA